MENHDQNQKHALPSSKSSTHGKADIGGADVVNCNGKEELTQPEDVMDEKNQVVPGELDLEKLVQDREGHEKMMTFSGTRPATMAASGPNGTNHQLTIFYGGRICVFDFIPAEKVQEILLIATAAAPKTVKPAEMNAIGTQPPSASVPSPQSATYAFAPIQALCLAAQKSSLCRLQEIPIARRHSLQRFLEKRRDRLATKSPYPSPSEEIDGSVENNSGDKLASGSDNFKQSEEEFGPAILAS